MSRGGRNHLGSRCLAAYVISKITARRISTSIVTTAAITIAIGGSCNDHKLGYHICMVAERGYN